LEELFVFFLIFQLAFAYYIFNYTPQEKNPSSLYILPQNPTRLIYSQQSIYGVERNLIVGSEDGFISYFMLEETPSSLLPEGTNP
jgi:hypothetical protein